MTLGDPSLDDDHRLKELWLECRYRGPVMGTMPFAMVMALEDDEADKAPGPFVVPFRFWRIGVDHTSRRNGEWDWSDHLAFNVPGLFHRDPRRLLFGPTVGFGLNLTWWERWKDVADYTVNTGKVTAETGWVLGFDADNTLFAQARATAAVDLFGIHQSSLNMSGIAGFFLGRWHVPLGMEITAEMDRGNDTWDTLSHSTWSARAALVWRFLPDAPEPDLEDLLKAMHEAHGAAEPEPLPIDLAPVRPEFEPPPPITVSPPEPPPSTTLEAPVEPDVPISPAEEQPIEEEENPEEKPVPKSREMGPQM